MVSIQKVQTPDRVTNQLQDNILQGVKVLSQQVDSQALPFNGGVLLTKIALINGATIIKHKLGKALTGWKLTRVRAQATIWDSQDSNQSPETTLVLNSNANVTVDIFCF